MTSSFPRAALATALLAVAARVTQAQAASPTHGLDRANIDTTCNACADFYQYANGAWLKRTEIPAAYTQYGTFREVADRADSVLHLVLEDAAKGSSDHSTREAGIYYATCMDTAAIDGQGISPLKARLAGIDAIASLPALRTQVAQLQMNGVGVMFATGSEPDFKNSAHVILALEQGGLGLPDRDYYTRTDSTSMKLRNTYLDHVVKTLVLAGESPSQAAHDAERVLAIETQLANASMTNVERRDPKKLYNPISLAAIDSLAPNLSYSTILRDAQAPTTSVIRVGQPSYVKNLSAMLTTVPLPDWKAYLRFHVVNAASPWLSRPFADEAFRMQQALTGAKEQLPRWKRCLAASSRSLGQAVGQAYVARTFTPDAKARALAMVRNMEAVLRERLSSLAWMSDTTRKFAIAAIRHEMTHGFDDQGRQFDAAGNLQDWWTASDSKAFDGRAAQVQRQFDSYVVLDSPHVNGKLTLGEDIADLGGLKIAYEAMERSISGKRPPPIDGFSPEQRFFLSWAQVWRGKARPETERQQVLTDPHAPSRWRVNGPLANMPEFAKAFGCTSGELMVRADSLRPQIW